MATIFPPETYMMIDRIFYENSEQLEQFVKEVERDIIPFLKAKRSFLDVGAGPALITRRLAKHFQDVTVVEPNTAFVKEYPVEKFTVHNSTFEECILGRSYDFVLCSHVLYHVDKKNHSAFLDKLIKSIDVGGQGLIIMLAPRGYNHAQCMRFNPNYPNSQFVIEYLESKKISHQVFKMTCRYTTKSLQDMHTLCRFFMIEDCFTPETYNALSPERLQEIENEIWQFAKNRQIHPTHFVSEYEEDHIIIFN